MKVPLNLDIILSATDKMSKVVNKAVNGSISKLNQLSEQSNHISHTAMKSGMNDVMLGAGFIATMYKPVQAFADLEDAGLRLKSVMMRDGGLVDEKMFKKVNTLAIDLGNKLPGTTQDFQELFAAMLENNITPKSILEGAGKAAAYLAVQLKIPTEEAGMLAAKVKQAMGVQDSEMMGLMDTIARMKNAGVANIEDIQNGFAKASGQLKFFGVQGLQASKDYAAMLTMFVNTGARGQTVGTNFARILTEISNPEKLNKANALMKKYSGTTLEFFKTVNGKQVFKGIPSMVAELSKLKGMDTLRIGEILKPLSGGEGMDDSVLKALSVTGMSDFNRVTNKLSQQATLQQKVDLMLTGLKLRWEAAFGNLTNAMASFAGTFAPLLKRISDHIANFAAKLQIIIEKHPRFFRFIAMVVSGIGAALIVAGGFGIALAGVARVVSFAMSGFSFLFKGIKMLQYGFFLLRYGMFLFSSFLTGTVVPAITTATAFLMANPIILIIAAIAVAATLIVIYWKPIKQFFIGLWNSITNIFSNVWNAIKAFAEKYKVILFLLFLPITLIPTLIIKYWSQITAFFKWIWNGIKQVISSAIDILIHLFLNFTPLGLIIKHWKPIIGFFSKIWENVKRVFKWAIDGIIHLFLNFTPLGFVIKHFKEILDYLSNVAGKFLQAGKNIVSSIGKGIKSAMSVPIDAIKKVTSSIRNWLPFSPAKEGPLKDIHKIRLVETIAESIKPGPMVKAMRLATAATLSAAMVLPTSKAESLTRESAGGKNQTSQQTVHINYAPVIHIDGGSPGAVKDFENILEKHGRKIAKIVTEEHRKNNRLKI